MFSSMHLFCVTGVQRFEDGARDALMRAQGAERRDGADFISHGSDEFCNCAFKLTLLSASQPTVVDHQLDLSFCKLKVFSFAGTVWF